MSERFFPMNHSVEILRGAKKLSPGKIRKALAKRSAWLSERLEATARDKGDVSGHPGLDELKATVQVCEVLDGAQEGAKKKKETKS